jgi:hypothetical protein
MKKRRTARNRVSGGQAEGSVWNQEHPLPRAVEALFTRQTSSDVRAAQAEHRLHSRVSQASGRLVRDQVKLLAAKARQLGVSDLVRDLEAARDRHLGAAIDAIEASHGGARKRGAPVARRRAAKKRKR